MQVTYLPKFSQNWSKCCQPIRLHAGFLKLEYLVHDKKYQPDFLDIDRYSLGLQTDNGDSSWQDT